MDEQKPQELKAKQQCAMCEDDLRDEEFMDTQEDGRICDCCYNRNYMGDCLLCNECVDNTELGANPGEIIVIFKTAPATPEDLQEGYYRVKDWPFFADSMIECHFYANRLDRVADLDERGRSASDVCGSISAPICGECRKRIESLIAKNSSHD